MGGETGLYGAGRQTAHTDSALIPPVNNSLILFECTPHSYHRFVANPGMVRNSIVMWLHCTEAHAVERWGEMIERRAPR